MNKMLLAAAAATAMISSAAYAIVTFDPETGTGFVGKGDVQLAFNWNNKAAQDNAKGVTFTFGETTSYDVTCEWETVTGGKNSKVIEHAVTNKKTSAVSSAIAYDARLKNQYTGYTLSGFGATTVTGGTVPAVGDSCPQGGSASDNDPSANDAVVTEVNENSSEGGLYVAFGSQSVLLQSL